ncbi:MAG: virulence factor, partial [Candidatus Obscuribacterales bacterium]|nr:virulence factor [Candidatus Obscuribacterales bacterium]
MQLTSIETTPNPNSMKLNLDESVGKPVTYTVEQRAASPDYVARLLDIEGVKSVFVCHDFITLNRDPRADWKFILDKATNILSGEQQSDIPLNEQRKSAEKLGQISVLVQTFRGIPIQVKTCDGHEEKRIAMSSRFSEAAQLVQAQSGADYLKERYWDDWGVRYESLEEVTKDVVEEIEGTLDAKAIERLVAMALEKTTKETSSRSIDQLQTDLDSDDWHQRLLAVQELGTRQEAITLLIRALSDPHQQVRRLVAAALGASGAREAVVPLTQVLLNDASIGVRRTAGDALSDLGDV